MMQCGGCSAQQVSQVVQILSNPGMWVVVGATLTAVLAAVENKKKEKK